MAAGHVSRIGALIEPSLESLGYALVRVRLKGETLQVMAERGDGGAMTVDACAEVSRAVSAILDVDDPIKDSYVLEVSSPGIDRPLVREADFERFKGHQARIEAARPVDGRKRFRGRLLGLEQGHVRIAIADGEAEIPFEDIIAAKLVLTDELIAAAKTRAVT